MLVKATLKKLLLITSFVLSNTQVTAGIVEINSLELLNDQRDYCRYI